MSWINSSIINAGTVPAIASGNLADAPTYNLANMLYVSLDTQALYANSGSGFVLIGGPGLGTVTGSGAAGQVAFWTGAQIQSGDSNLFWDNAAKYLGIGTTTPGTNVDIHSGNNVLLQLNNTTTNNTNIAFQNQGVAKWRAGNVYNAGANDFSVYDVTNSIDRLTISNAGVFALTGLANISSRLNVNGAIDNTSYVLNVNGSSLLSGNVLIGSTNTGANGVSLNQFLNYSFAEGSGESYVNVFRQLNTAAGVLAQGYKRSLTGSFASSYSGSTAKAAIVVGDNVGSIAFYSDAATTVANGTDIIPSIKMKLINNGSLLINGFDLTGNRTNAFNVLTLTANNPNAPYEKFGGAILFKNNSYVTGVVESARIRSYISDGGSLEGGGFIFETTPTAGGALTPTLTLSYTGAATFASRLNVNNATDNPSYQFNLSGNLFASGSISSNTLIAPSGALTVTGSIAAGRGRFQQNSVIPTGAIADYTLTATAGLYGIYMGVATSGVAWLQSGREDNSTTYDLLINPTGGAVVLGSTLGINGVADSVKGGTYTPTQSNEFNCSGFTFFQFRYTRVGNICTVQGFVTFTRSAALSSFDITLPIATTIAAGNGGGVVNSTSYLANGTIASTNSNTMTVSTNSSITSGALSYFLIFTYIIQ